MKAISRGDDGTTWEIKRETVYRLYRNGKPIRNADGDVVHYPSEAAAQATADTWESTRNWYSELRSMSDKELDARIEQLGWRAALRRRLWGWSW